MALPSQNDLEQQSVEHELLRSWVARRLWGLRPRSRRQESLTPAPQVVERLEDRCLMSVEPLISEFLAKNTSVLADQDGDFEDWVEIRNPNASSINLKDWSLTDDPADLTKWTFPNVTLAANEYRVVFASGKNHTSGELHTNFKLDEAGEYLALVRPNGSIAQQFAPKFPEQSGDVSFGLFNNVPQFFDPPTPRAANQQGYIGEVADTKVSVDHGFFTDPITVALMTSTIGATIRFTTNGSTPTATNGTVYTAPLEISKTTVLRATAFKEGFKPSDVDTQTYLFLADVLTQSPNEQAPPGFPTGVNGQDLDYGMDPTVVNSATYGPQMIAALKAIPSFSIVTDLPNLFDAKRGIYVNASQDTIAWERPTSIELINPDGSDGFQANAGLRVRGGFSRSSGNPKHALRLFFREQYGDSQLDYPLFGDDGDQVIQQFDLRTSQNYSWSFQADPRGVFVRDIFSRDTQRDLGQPYTRGNFYHLYINGQYWGLYQTQERSEADYAAAYFGGNEEDYDVVKVESGPYTINATDGNLNAWKRLWDAVNNIAATTNLTDRYNKFLKLQGKNPDGTDNPNFEVLLDVDNLIDYQLVIEYTGNLDASVSAFFGNGSPNNWYGIRSHAADNRQGFQFFAHDSEHTLLNVQENRVGPFSAGNTFEKSSPQWIHQQLMTVSEYRVQFGDRAQQLLFNGGALTPEKVAERFRARTDEIQLAVIAESARWGDSKLGSGTPPLTKANWLTAVNNILNNYFPQRRDVLIQQLRNAKLSSGGAAPLFPSLNAPVLNQHGGQVTPGFRAVLSGSGGQFYYTLDGSDPRLIGGALSPSAILFVPGGGNSISINETGLFRARTMSGSNWSALTEARFYVNAAPTAGNLTITEINYHPLPPTPAEKALNAAWNHDSFEFIELQNTGSQILDLANVRFSEGVQFDFTNIAFPTLAPGARVLIVNDRAAFEARYGTGLPIAGQFTGSLNDNGEKLLLLNRDNAELLEVKYQDGGAWPSRADGLGSSLQAIADGDDVNDADHWRASTEFNGSPGAEGLPPINSVIINEVLTHTDLPQLDSIELFNPTDSAIDLSGFYLSDDSGDFKKFRIPDGMMLAAGAFLVFDEDDFNPSAGVDPNDFALDGAHGDEVWLIATDANDKPSRFIDHVDFGSAFNGESIGLWPAVDQPTDLPRRLVPMTSVTLGGSNSGPRLGQVVLSEIMYHPQPTLGVHEDDLEFIEIHNTTNATVDLTNWLIDGDIHFGFAPNTTLAADARLAILPFDPAKPENAESLQPFRNIYGLAQSAALIGGYSGHLDDKGGTVRLLRPDAPPVEEPTFVPHILEDGVDFKDSAPWPTAADGGGRSLTRVDGANWGFDPASWTAELPTAGPLLIADMLITRDGLGNLLIEDIVAGGSADNLTIVFVPGSNSFVIRNPGHQLRVTTPKGVLVSPNEVRMPIGAVTGPRVRVLLSGGNDVVTIDLVGGLSNKTIDIDGGLGADDVQLVGAATTVPSITYRATGEHSGETAIGTLLVRYTDVAFLTDTQLANDRRFEIDSTRLPGNIAAQATIDPSLATRIAIGVTSFVDSPVVRFGMPNNGVTLAGGTGHDALTVASLPAGYAKKFVLLGGLGDDTLTSTAASATSLDGGDGNDRLQGGIGKDTLTGGGGNDTLFGDAGDDSLVGEAGNDQLSGGLGNDTLTGDTNDTLLETADVNFTMTSSSLLGLGTDKLAGFGAARLAGGASNNVFKVTSFSGRVTLLGGGGDDSLMGGGSGATSLDGEAGNNTLTGGSGVATLLGGLGNDSLTGGSKNDLLDGGDGTDLLNGAGGIDTLFGGADADTLFGGAGNDSLSGGAANDSVDGGDGNDLLLAADGDDTLNGGKGTDTLTATADADWLLTNTQLTGVGTQTLLGIEAARLTGGDGHNRLDVRAFTGPTTLTGGNGNDTLIGGSGNDVIDGGIGDDGLAGLGGNDTITGGSGLDTLLGGLGNDSLSGGNDDDTVLGQAGKDKVSGDLGTNKLAGGSGLGKDSGDTLIGAPGEIDETFSLTPVWL